MKKIKRIWKLILLLLLFVLTFAYAMFQGGFVSWFLFYSFLPFAIYCIALSVYPLSSFDVKRILPKAEYNAGEPLNVTVQFKRENRFPLFYLMMADNLTGELRTAKTLVFPGIKKEFSYAYRIEKLPRGEHVFRGITIKTGDLLGLFEKEKTLITENKINVYPAYTEVSYRPFQNQYDQGLTASSDRVQRDTTMAVGVRDYQPGDRFSWINWKASAKRLEIMTKEFEQRQSHDVFVVMDCIPHKNFEAVVSFTASLVRAILKKGAQTGLLTVNDERTSFPVRGGEQHLHRLFFHLAKIKAKSLVPIEKVLETEFFSLQQTISYMVITAQLTRSLIEKASVTGLRKGSMTLFLIKSQEELPTEEEYSLIAVAKARSIRVMLLHEGEFAAAFSEVMVR